MIWLFCTVQITWILTLLRNVPVVTQCKVKGFGHGASRIPYGWCRLPLHTVHLLSLQFSCGRTTLSKELGIFSFYSIDLQKKKKKFQKTWIFIFLFLFFLTLNLHILRNVQNGLSLHSIVIFQTHKKYFIKIFNLMSKS